MTPVTATTVPTAPAAPRLDFPSWLPAMLVKELRQGLRARGFVGSFMGFQTVMIIAFFYAAVLPGGEAFDAANGMFWSLFGVLLLGVTPLRALAGLGSEIEGRSVDLLVLTRLNASRIVVGKWVSLMAQAALLAAALLPYGVLRYYLGSVDLVSDLSTMAGLFGGCALLTAIALWVSSWPKGLRLLVGVSAVPAFLMLGNFMSMVGTNPMLRYVLGSRYGYSSTPVAGWESAVLIAVLVYDGLLLIGFSLIQAARRLAPPAENHASATRVLALLTLLPPPLLALLVGAEMAAGHLMLSAGALFIVCGMELSRVAEPMRVQVRPWLNSRRGWRVLSGPFLLPGWPSATLFTIVALGLLLGVTLLTDIGARSWFSPPFLTWWLALAWVSLVFPILTLTFLGNFWRFSVPGYWIVQGLMAILGIISLGGTPGPHAKTYLLVMDAVSQILPGSSFWLGWQWVKPDANWAGLTYTPLVFIGQFAVLVGTILLYRSRSRLYWRIVWDHASAQPRAPTGPPA